MYKLLSFDVYGTLVNTPPTNAEAFRIILEEAGAPNIDALAFYQFWESRNIVHYRELYRSYREIGELSLEEAFENFGIAGGRADLIERYFELFPEMQLYPDVLPTLEKLAGKYRLAVVSNIDDDLLRATRLHREFDLICTAERARGYKPDGPLFRYLIANSGVGVAEILHSGQSQFTDMVGGKPLGLTVAWVNRRSIDLDPSVPKPDHIFSDIQSLCRCSAFADLERDQRSHIQLGVRVLGSRRNLRSDLVAAPAATPDPLFLEPAHNRLGRGPGVRLNMKVGGSQPLPQPARLRVDPHHLGISVGWTARGSRRA